MQKQYKISLSEHLDLQLKEKSKDLGIPTTQFIKYLIVRYLDDLNLPVYLASKDTIESAEEALADIENAVELTSVEDLDKLCK